MDKIKNNQVRSEKIILNDDNKLTFIHHPPPTSLNKNLMLPRNLKKYQPKPSNQLLFK